MTYERTIDDVFHDLEMIRSAINGWIVKFLDKSELRILDDLKTFSFKFESELSASLDTFNYIEGKYDPIDEKVYALALSNAERLIKCFDAIVSRASRRRIFLEKTNG